MRIGAPALVHSPQFELSRIEVPESHDPPQVGSTGKSAGAMCAACCLNARIARGT
jgi:hypothetical protein